MGGKGSGPKPKPKELINDPYLRKRVDEGPDGTRGIPEPPDTITTRARVYWNHYAPMLDEMGVLCIEDAQVLARYCETLVLYWDCTAFLAKHGTIYREKTDNDREGQSTGPVKQWPHVVQVKAHRADLLKLEQELGLTPSARTALSKAGMKKPEERDALDDILAGISRGN